MTSVSGQSVERTSELPAAGKVLARLLGGARWMKLGGEWHGDYTDQADLELRTMDFDGTNYMVFSTNTHGGAYRYPELQVDYMVWTVHNHFLFDKSRLAEILPENVEFNKSYAVYLDPVFSVSGTMSIEREMYFALEKDRQKKLKVSKIMIGVFPVIQDGKKKVRYFVKIEEDGKKLEFNPTVFDKEYFEIEYDKFYKFVNLGKKPPKDKSGKGDKN
jgi:hypothetical protein